MRLYISHTTSYTYRDPVVLLPHRMMLSPRTSPVLSPIFAEIRCMPAAELTWTQDVFGNLIATASFSHLTTRLAIRSLIVVEQTADAWPVFNIAPHAHNYPFRYSEQERSDLGGLLAPVHRDPGGRLATWARASVQSEPTDTLALLQDVNTASRNGIAYVARESEGTQLPGTTLELGSGSCRDIAMLFIEAVRHLGFAARAVSGYVLDPLANDPGGPERRHDATHAWAEVYLPCAGWIAFDPTNGRMGDANLVPVAVGRDIARLSPVEGHYLGPAAAFLGMTVEVTVSADALQASASNPECAAWNPD
jgi:transglutaminase-like putative cysteine protease